MVGGATLILLSIVIFSNIIMNADTLYCTVAYYHNAWWSLVRLLSIAITIYQAAAAAAASFLFLFLIFDIWLNSEEKTGNRETGIGMAPSFMNVDTTFLLYSNSIAFRIKQVYT